jgi:hypothetical protein
MSLLIDYHQHKKAHIFCNIKSRIEINKNQFTSFDHEIKLNENIKM